MIPCIKNKCILYPTCIDKVEIECSDLEEYFNELYIAYEDFKDTISEIWKTINKTYPNLKKVSIRTQGDSITAGKKLNHVFIHLKPSKEYTP